MAISRRTPNITAAKERQGQVEAMIADIEDKLARAQVIDPTTLSGDKVVFGATVHLVDEDDSRSNTRSSARPRPTPSRAASLIPRRSAAALIGRKVDDEVEVSVPAGDRYYLVSGIEFV